MVSRYVLVASAFTAVATAQSSAAATMQASSTVPQSMPPQATAGFNPGNVSTTDAFNWCLAQRHSCPEICGGSASTNLCDSTAFTYQCICANGTEPDCTAYEQTLPFYICQATFVQCIADHPNDSIGQNTCMTNEQCGTKNATSGAVIATGSSSGTASATATSSMASGSAASSASGSAASSAAASGASSASASAASASATKGAAAFTNEVATGAFAAVFLAAFKLLL